MKSKITEAIEYWEGLFKTFSKQLETEENYFGRMHLQTTIDILDTTINALTQLCEQENDEEGYWFLLDDCLNEGVYCSKCHKKVYKKDYANQKLKSKFCPNCGKKMGRDFKVL